MAGMIAPEIVEQVRHACDIVDVIGGYVPLKKSGAKYKALSPFNKEKTPSFFVDPSKQIFKCFSSGHGGDVFKFLMLMENMTFPEAIRRQIPSRRKLIALRDWRLPCSHRSGISPP